MSVLRYDVCRVGGGIVGHLIFRLNLVQARKMLKAMESPKDGHVPGDSAPSRWSCKSKSKARTTYVHGLDSRR